MLKNVATFTLKRVDDNEKIARHIYFVQYNLKH